MPTKKEKKVTYIELIYDLVFVYMVGRDNSLLGSVQNGFIEPMAFLTYGVSALSIIQIWNFTTFYINMFGRNGLRDHICLLTNMYLMYFIGEATRTDVFYISLYHIPWCLILVNIGLQYFIELRNHKADVWNRGVIWRMGTTLMVEAAIVLVAAFLQPFSSAIVSFIAIVAGIVLTAMGRVKSVGGQVDFAHLTERAMLYVVFTFGEMVIAVARFFRGSGRTFDPVIIYYSLMTFLVAVGLFLSYEIVYDYLVDREGNYTGLMYMMIHIFILFALNNVTVSFEFMQEPEIDRLPKLLLFSLSLVTYYVFLFLLKGHFRARCGMNRLFLRRVTFLSAFYIAGIVLLQNEMQWSVLITVVYTFAVVLLLYRMKAVQDEKIKRKKEAEEAD